MKVAHALALLGVNLAVSACVAGPPPGPIGVVAPGKDKSQAAFQQDQTVCQQHAVAQTGYGNPSQNPADHLPADGTLPGSGGGSAAAAVSSGTEPPGEVSYLQCMAARGDIVQLASTGGYYGGYSYAYPYPYGYGYPYVWLRVSLLWWINRRLGGMVRWGLAPRRLGLWELGSRRLGPRRLGPWRWGHEWGHAGGGGGWGHGGGGGHR